MEPTQTSSKKGLSYGIVIAIVVIAVIAAVAKYSFQKTDETASVTESTPTESSLPTTSQNGSTETSGSTYKNGTYTATGSYVSPGGPESISVKLTLANDVITDATVVSEAENPTSKQFQNLFISGFKTQVIGKNISDVKLDKVSGSSLTPKGFNDAVVKIQAEAKA